MAGRAVPFHRHGAGQSGRAGEMAPAGAHGALRREQLQRLRTGPPRHRQEPYLQGNQPEQHPDLRRPDHGGQSLLQHGPADGGSGRPLGSGGLRRGGRHLLQGQGRRADHEGLHGLGLLRPGQGRDSGLGQHGLRRQYQPARGHPGEDQPSAGPLPGDHDRFGLLRSLPCLYPGLGSAQDAPGVLYQPVWADHRLSRRVHARDAQAQLLRRHRPLVQARAGSEPARYHCRAPDGFRVAEAALSCRGLR